MGVCLRIRAFSIVELVIALAVIVVGFFTFFSVFSTSSQHAIQTQNRAAANMLAQSYMDEFKEHIFGTPSPESWNQEIDEPLRMVVKDRETNFVFHKRIEFKTGAFIGDSDGDTDVVTLVVTWREAAGSDQTTGAPTGHPEDNKMLKVEMPVWR